MNGCSSKCKRAVGAWQTRLARAVGSSPAQERRGNDRAVPETRPEPIDDVRQALAAQGRRVEEPELALPRGPEPRGRETNQADRARDWVTLEEREGAAIELEAILGRFAGGAPRVRLERGEAELERDAARGERALSQLRRDALGVGAQRRPELFRVGAVDAERLFRTDRLRHAVRLDRAIVTAERQVVESLAVLPEASRQELARSLLELTDGGEAEIAESPGHDLAHAPEALDGQSTEESSLIPGGDDHEPVGLLQLGGHLGDELVGREPSRRRQARLVQNAALDVANRVGRAAEQGLGAREIDERLVDRHRLDQRRELDEDAHDLHRDPLVLLHVDRQERGVWAEPRGARDGHRRADAVRPGFVGSGGHHAAPARARAHDDGPATQLRAIALLDRRVERVHVDVRDRPRARGHPTLRPSSGATPVSAATTNAMCSSSSTPSSVAPR